MEKSVVRVENLSHRYNVQWAIRDINFEIDQRGVVGLLGSNGAGKSTTMNIICGVLKQTQGEVYVDGINFRENPVEAKRNIGFLPQKPPLYMDFTVDEYLTYCADLRMVDKMDVKKAVDEAKAGAGFHISAVGWYGIYREGINSVWELRRRSCIIRSSWCWTSRRMVWTRTRSWRCGI